MGPPALTRVLIVDDEPDVAWVISRDLQTAGYEVTTASSFRSGQDALETKRPEVVLLDLRLPDGDGLELLRRIRDSQDSPVVILLTGHATIESAVRAMKLGAFDYLIKPVHLEEVRLVIEKGLEARRLAAEVQTLRAALRE